MGTPRILTEERNYYVVGTIWLYVNHRLHKTYNFDTQFQRRKILVAFLDEVKAIRHAVNVYWSIEVDEDSIRPMKSFSSIPKLPLKPTYIPPKESAPIVFRTQIHKVNAPSNNNKAKKNNAVNL